MLREVAALAPQVGLHLAIEVIQSISIETGEGNKNEGYSHTTGIWIPQYSVHLLVVGANEYYMKLG